MWWVWVWVQAWIISLFLALRYHVFCSSDTRKRTMHSVPRLGPLAPEPPSDRKLSLELRDVAEFMEGQVDLENGIFLAVQHTP